MGDGDKNLLSWGKTIEKFALYVKGKIATTSGKRTYSRSYITSLLGGMPTK